MSFLASLAVLAVTLPQGASAPQAGGQETRDPGKALLTPAEQESLRKKLAEYNKDDETYELASGKEREKAGRDREKSKEGFEKEWDKYEKKGNLLASMPDLRAIFDNCFSVKAAAAASGTLRKETAKLDEKTYDYYYHAPKTYKPTVSTPTLVVLPGTTTAQETAQWVKPQDYFAAVWDKSTLVAHTMVSVCTIPAGLELDPIPDYSRQGADQDEDSRIRSMLVPLGDLMRTFNVERGRLFLDCGRGASGFGLRFMTLFPDRFAAAVLRSPVEVDDIRLGSLTNSSVLLLRTPATAAKVDALKKRLDEAAPGTATVLDAADEYPHPGSAAAIETWLKERRRNMYPPRVVLEPNHDRFKRAYWVSADVADSLLTAAPDKKPRLEVEADRKANRIVVKAVGVERFTLMLNDDLVDLDKEFTVVINDKPVSEKRTRSFRSLRNGVLERTDWDYLFTASFTTAVPKE